MLRGRLTKILRELMAAECTITSDQIAHAINVTSRTVRNDIKELDAILQEHGCRIISTRGAGYKLKVEKENLYKKFLYESIESEPLGYVPCLPEERERFLLKRILLAENYLKLEELADELFISKSTIQNDLKQVKKTLKKYNLKLEKKPNYGIRLVGKERKLRYCLSEHLFKEMNHNYLNQFENLSIMDTDLSMLPELILEQIKENGITLSDVGLNNLILHILIAYKRIQNENYVSLDADNLKKVINQKEYQVAADILHEIEEKLEIVIPQEEIAYIAMHLMGTKMLTQVNSVENELRPYISEEVYHLAVKIVHAIEAELKLGIKNDKELVTAICLHLKPAINRFKYEMNIRNPMLDDIKRNYPMAFEAGIIAGRIIKEEFNITVNDDEIGYLALHIGAAIERRKMKKERKTCLVVCASGVGSARLLSYKLQDAFGSKLEIAGTTEYYKLNDYPIETLDFIISTIPIADNLPVPTIEVNTFLTPGNLEEIKKALGENGGSNFKYTREELVFLQQNLTTKEEVLTFLTRQLQMQGLVDEFFLESVLEREEVSPTSFGNLVAIPHPLKPCTDETFWTVCTLQKPIDWSGKKVQFVCLLTVKKDNNEDLQDMYKKLIRTVEDINVVQDLVKCKTFDEFVTIFEN